MRSPDILPEQLQDYSHDRTLSRQYLGGSHLFFLTATFFFLAACYFLMKRQMVISAASCGTLAVGILAYYIYRQQFKKHRIICRSCREPMEVVDTPVPKEKLSPMSEGLDKDIDSYYQVTFVTPNRESYMMSRDSDSGRVTLFKMFQRWYACHTCKVCFLAEPRVYDNLREFSNSAEAIDYKKSSLDRI